MSGFALYPAIDLKGGHCVRLLRGDMSQATVFGQDPAAQAAKFRDLGFEKLHVVDLDGAFAGKSVNGAAVAGILKATDAAVQLGGGIRDLAAVEAWLAAGLARVILGTVALKNPALVKAAARRFPGRIAVGIDARGGKVAVEGWAEESNVAAIDLAKAMEQAGVAALIHTDIDRDGAMQGVNAAATEALARAVGVPVIASGGVSSLDDVKRLLGSGRIAGAVIGRAFYDGSLDPGAALALARG